MHDAYIGGLSENNIKCVMHDDLGWKTKQLNIFCRITGFMSDFLSFIVMEHIRFFHGALQLYVYDTKFRTEEPLTLKVLADNGSDIHATESNIARTKYTAKYRKYRMTSHVRLI